MNIVCLLTTWNRPKLLEQALRHIEREARSIAAPLVICDDASTDRKTVTILEEARVRGVDVQVRQWPRTEFDNPHFALGYNAVYGFKYVLEKYQPDAICKFDDDCILSEGALPTLIKSYQEALDDKYEVLACSGIKGIYENVIYEPAERSYCVIGSPCAVTCIYPAHPFDVFLKNTSQGEIAAAGWDHKYIEFRNKWFGNAVFVNTHPHNVSYHTGFHGTHLSGVDVNTPGRFCGDLEGVITE